MNKLNFKYAIFGLITSCILTNIVTLAQESDSLLVYTKNDGVIKELPDITSKVIYNYKKGTSIYILDYVADNYYTAICDSVIGYISRYNIEEDKLTKDNLDTLMYRKNMELYRIRQMQYLKDLDKQFDEYKKAYGNSIAYKLNNSEVWLGMTENMLLNSVGRPSSINETVGSWGVKRQYVYRYDGVLHYYYFKNGYLTSYQR